MQIQHVLEPWHLLFNRSTTFQTPHCYASSWLLAAGYIVWMCLPLYLPFLTVCTGNEHTVYSCLTWHIWDIYIYIWGQCASMHSKNLFKLKLLLSWMFYLYFDYLILCIHSVSLDLYSLIFSISIFICSFTHFYICINGTIYSCSSHSTSIEWPG